MTDTLVSEAPRTDTVQDAPPGSFSVTVIVRRFDPDVDDEPRWQDFDVMMLPTDRILDALHKIKTDGPKRQLVGVEIEGANLGSFNDGAMIDVFEVHDPHGLRIGEVTSAAHSPRVEGNIGYAMVPIAYQEPGTELVVRTQHGPQQAVVSEKPFLDPTKDIPKRLARSA